MLRIFKILITSLIIIAAFSQNLYAGYIYDIDNTIVDQIDWNTKKEDNEYKSQVSEYYMLPTAEELMEWDIDPEILEDMEPFQTNFNGINNKMISMMERYWKRGYYLSIYDLRASICAFNLITNNPGHDYRIILNYPVDGRKYTFLNMDLFSMDFQEIIKMRKFRGINVDIRNGLIDKTVKFFYDWAPNQFEPPVIPQDYGLYPTRKARQDYEVIQYYGWTNALKEESYIFYLEDKEKTGSNLDWPRLLNEAQKEIIEVRNTESEFYDENYETKIWRQATYSSRWNLSDIQNGLVGAINTNELRRTGVTLKSEAKTSSRNTVNGVLLISEIMNKLGYQTSVPGTADIENVLKYSKHIIDVANHNDYYRYVDQYDFHELKEELTKTYNTTFEDTAWRHTVAYLVTSNAVN